MKDFFINTPSGTSVQRVLGILLVPHMYPHIFYLFVKQYLNIYLAPLAVSAAQRLIQLRCERLQHVESYFLHQGSNLTSCTGRQFLNHWTIKEVSTIFFFPIKHHSYTSRP